MEKLLELTEHDAECFIETLKQAGIRQHSHISLGGGLIADVYDNDLLHTEFFRVETNGKLRVSMKLSGKKNGTS